MENIYYSVMVRRVKRENCDLVVRVVDWIKMFIFSPGRCHCAVFFGKTPHSHSASIHLVVPQDFQLIVNCYWKQDGPPGLFSNLKIFNLP